MRVSEDGEKLFDNQKWYAGERKELKELRPHSFEVGMIICHSYDGAQKNGFSNV